MKKAGRFLRIVIATSIALVAILAAFLLPGCITRRRICDPVHNPSTDLRKTDDHPMICDPVHPGPKVSPPDPSTQQK